MAILSVKNLSVSIKKDSRIIVDKVSFNIEKGEILILSGANGCGKTTIIRSILGEIENEKIYSGTILFDDQLDILTCKETQLRDFRKRIGYVPQEDVYNSIGRRINVATILNDSAESYYKRHTLSKEEMHVLLHKFAPGRENKPQFDISQKPQKLSGGQQRLLSIISAIAVRKNAAFFIIDEPLNNLDYDNMRNISNLINSIHKENDKAAFLIVTHCRIFPFVTRRLEIISGKIVSESYIQEKCYDCIGKPNNKGFYE